MTSQGEPGMELDVGKMLHGRHSVLFDRLCYLSTLITLRSYLDPDPLLLATRQGKEGNVSNPRFHSLNQAIVQLVR